MEPKRNPFRMMINAVRAEALVNPQTLYLLKVNDVNTPRPIRQPGGYFKNIIMREVVEVRANTIYTTNTTKLQPKIELVIVHTDGMLYESKGKTIITRPLLRETRFFADAGMLDKLIADLQKWKMSMVTLQQNADVLNDIVEKINTKTD